MSAVLELALDADKEYEIVDGQMEEKVMAGARHGEQGTRLIIRLGAHVEANNLGVIYGPDTTFTIGQNQRLPDISFVAAERMPETGSPEGIWDIAPDLAVEILSPNDDFEKTLGKIKEYLAAGVRQVWLVSPEHQLIMVFDPPFNLQLLDENKYLEGGDIIPGFRCRVGDLFKPFARR